MKVCNFSGSTTNTVERMKAVAKLINDGTPKIIVLSAPEDIKKHLDEIAACLFNREIDEAHNKITKLEFQFIDFTNILITDRDIKQLAVTYIINCFQQIWRFTKNSFSAAEEKEVLAQGELIISALMNFYLQEQNAETKLLNAPDFIRMKLDGKPNSEFIEKRFNHVLTSYPEKKLFIIQGSICQNDYDETEYIKSEYSTMLIGQAIHAEEIQIWSENTLYNNDSQMVEDSKLVKHLSFDEAERLVSFNTQILQSDSLTIAKMNKMPIRLLNSSELVENPLSVSSTCFSMSNTEGTLISDRHDESSIKAVAAKDSILFIKFESNNVLRPYLFTSKVFEAFGKYQISPCLITASGTKISAAMDYRGVLSPMLQELNKYAQVRVEDRMSVISVIGTMKWQCSAERDVIEALRDIPLRMIAYGGNNNDISLVIKTTDKKKALQTLNNKLFERA